MSALRRPRVIVGLILAASAMIGSRILLPVTMPHITLAPEKLGAIGPVPLTNTMLALLASELLLIGAALWVRLHLKERPSGLQAVFEAVVEFWQDQAHQLIGPRLTQTWLPLILTVFLLIWFSNYLHFLPGFDSVGVLCRPGHCPGEVSAPVGGEGAAAHSSDHTTYAVRWTGGEEGRGVGLITGPADTDHALAGYAFVPLLRVAASDLNFTLALALIAFVAIEIVGLRTWGPRYLTKFVHIDFRHGIGNGLLSLFVGLIELVSELARIISFAFRLFGNIFAGSVLLVVFMFLAPFVLVIPIYGLELFVGLIQAFVFAILILAFITLALAPLHGDDRH